MDSEDIGVALPGCYPEYPSFIRDQSHESSDLFQDPEDLEQESKSEEDPVEFRRRFKKEPAKVGIQPSQFLTWINEDPQDLTTWIWQWETKLKEQHDQYGRKMRELFDSYKRKIVRLDESKKTINCLKQEKLILSNKVDRLEKNKETYAELERDFVNNELEVRRLRVENRAFASEINALKLKGRELLEALQKAQEAQGEQETGAVNSANSAVSSQPVLVSQRPDPNIMERNAELQEEVQQLRELLDRKEDDMRKMRLNGYQEAESEEEAESSHECRRNSSKKSAVKPLKWSHPKFDGKPENLTRYIHRAETDFELYPDSFGNEKRKVHYALQGLDTRPDNWAQQYYESDPEGVLLSWELYKEKVKLQFEDPNLMINRRTQMLNIRATSYSNFQDFLAEFESLNATVRCDEGTAISFFLQALPWRVETQIRRDGINGMSFQQIKLKAITLQQEEERLQQVRNRTQGKTRTLPRKDADRFKPQGQATNRTERTTEDRQCYNCGKKGHISINCPKKASTVEMKVIEDDSETEVKESKN